MTSAAGPDRQRVRAARHGFGPEHADDRERDKRLSSSASAGWGRKVSAARWAYDGAAQGGRKIAFGNTWVVAAVVCRLRFCRSPVARPALLRPWCGKGTASQAGLAAKMMQILAAAFPGRALHGTGDAALHGESLAMAEATWTTPAAGQRGAVRAAAPAHRQTRPAAGQRRPAGHLRPGRARRGLGREGHQRLWSAAMVGQEAGHSSRESPAWAGPCRRYPAARCSRAAAMLGRPSAAETVQMTNFVGPMNGLREVIACTCGGAHMNCRSAVSSFQTDRVQ